ncbi:RagB/SusD family nutrient uptake outer membrane protein [Dyadobacter psychrotolerans]|uniref:RagB/SusD family nutrient uptake outer membrane protein n=1 Tax=Dyadobacter psychrotolerans TaxID=2541721 RepID=A0A4R5DMU2_9BACT|nr:RagB/SusD family nutrient uptake outer membrane protein [Dyadobacter psychrotolerans]TDE15479.1 RagB/SusD family nutrient uptake outer membrane protein [Dyadobacter psychrotolerans]
MKNILSKKSFWALMVLLNVIGCKSNDEFLKENPETFYTVDNAFSTSAQVDQVLVGIYSQIRDLWANPAEEGWIFVLRGNGTDMYDVASIRRGATFNNYGLINVDNGTFYNIYSTYYQMIAKANLALEAAQLPQISFSSEAEKANIIAQAKFFRAYAYRNLGELFGGVSIVTSVSKVPQYDFKRSTRVETYQFAIDDLLAAEKDLPETTVSGGRVVKGAAQHYLAELYLAMGTQLVADGKASEGQAAFAQSIAYATKVIDGGTYSLMKTRFGARSTEAQGNVYWDLFQENNVNYQNGNKESIWTLQVDYAAYRAEDGKSKLPYSRTYGAVFRDGAKDHLTGTAEDVGGRGIAQMIPTFYVRDDIYADKYATDLRNSEIVFRRVFNGNVKTSPYFGKPVPWDVLYNGSADATTNMNNRSLVYPISCKIATDKYTGLADGENMSNLFRDDYFIRLSETILLRAEAKQRSGNKAGAAADVNLLRSRANATYLVSAADMDDSFNMILDERARELVYEEARWNTLLRMGGTIAVDRIKKYAFWPEAKATLTFNYNLWPIPQTIIDTNKDVVLEQNPGWKR